MSNTKTVMSQAANTLAKPLEVEDVFSTYLYEGTSATHVIDNGIDLDGEGGLVWTKVRTITDNHYFWDTERGVNKRLSSNQSFGENNETDALNSFNSDGFTLGSALNVNGSAANWGSAADYASWTFRKAPKFFDVVTYTGNGVAGREIAHNLGSVPGSIFVKKTSGANNWLVYHRSLGNSAYARLNTTDESFADGGANWNSTTPTSTVFTLGSDGNVNDSDGSTYVAYLFAHNDGDGGFNGGDIIKCGSYTGNGNSTDGPEIDLGFEPQWVMIKRTDTAIADSWIIHDTMRGIASGGVDPYLLASSSASENSISVIDVTPTGFKLTAGYGGWDGSGGTYIYIAIRRGTKAPESATEVFAIDAPSNTTPVFVSGFTPDMGFWRYTASTNTQIMSRITGQGRMYTNLTNASSNSSSTSWDYQNGWFNDTSIYGQSAYSWMWKRAPKFFDAVAYTGDSNAGRTVSHNLTVAPEMMWVKNRNGASGGARPWIVYHKDTGNTGYLKLNETSALITSDPQSKFGNGTVGVSPTASDFTVAGDYEVNYSGDTYIAYLFASLPGISKVGSYTGDGTTDGSKVIDCGFTSGARFVLIKTSSHSDPWLVFDSVRGIVSSGNDPYLRLNDTSAEQAGLDVLDPQSSGFGVRGYLTNVNNYTYIFYAIA